MRRIGIVTGSRLEARCLGGDHRFAVGCSGASAGRARAQALRLIEQGARGLVSFGFAGGLDPALGPGILIVPETVLLKAGDGDVAAPAAHVTESWRGEVFARLMAAGLAPARGTVLGSDRMIATPPLKAYLHRKTGAAAVDMESHEVARAAEAAGVPWLVLRAIVDPADLALPQFVDSALQPDGRVRPRAIVEGLIRGPKNFPALFRLRAYSRAALRMLLRAARALDG